MYVDPFVATLAVDSDFSIARCLRARAAWMAHCLTLVSTFVSQLTTALTTAVFHELFAAGDAFPWHMADFLAQVAAVKFGLADLTTIVVRLVAEDVRQHLLAAVAHARHRLEAGRTVSVVALQRASMPAFELLLAWTSAGGRWDSTLDRRIELGNTTWAVQGLG